jgi:transcriptional regulator with XRE-family HTH domain
MPLPQEELKRRIEAARILRKLSQKDLNKRFEEDGLGKGTAGRVERGELDFRRAHRDAFVRHLGVDARWFTEHSVDAVLRYIDEESLDARLTGIERSLIELLSQLAQLAARGAASASARGPRAVRPDDPPQDPPGEAGEGSGR